MSWLQFDSLNSIKDQFTNFAGDILNDLVDEKDNTNGNQGATHLEQQSHDGNSASAQGPSSCPSQLESKIISDLKHQIQCLKNEKRDLSSSLDQIENDNQQTVEKLVEYKDSLQGDLNRSKCEYDILKHQYDKLKDCEVANMKRIKELSVPTVSGEESGFGKPDKMEALMASTKSLEEENASLKQQLKTLETSLKADIQILEEEKMKSDIEISQLKQTNEELSQSNQSDMISADDYSKLECILQEYETRVKNYEEELKELQTNASNSIQDKDAEEESLQNIVESSNKIIESKNVLIQELGDELLDFKTKLNVHENEISKQLSINKDYENENAELKKHRDLTDASIQTLTTKNHSTLAKLSDLQEENNKLSISLQDTKECYSTATEQVSQLHKEHSQLIQSIYCNCFGSSSEECNLDLTIVRTQISKINDFVVSTKSELSTLHNEVTQLTDQKNKLLQEKNFEINKLTQNSSTLKQDLLNKNIEFEEFETEYNELLKTNDLMLAEIQSHKSNNLVTISESNEDNMLQLETDLENAKLKIKELEVIVSSLENSREDISDSERSRPDSAMSNVPFEMLQKSFEDVKYENHDLQTALDKIKNDYENLDYKFNEQVLQIDVLREEVLSKDKLSTALAEENHMLVQTISELKDANENTLNDISKELIIATESNEKYVSDIRMLSEKLQGSKMTETSLKLQYDTQLKDLNELKKIINLSQETQSIKENDLRSNYDAIEAENKTLRDKMKTLIENNIDIVRLRDVPENDRLFKTADVSVENVCTELEEINLDGMSTAINVPKEPATLELDEQKEDNHGDAQSIKPEELIEIQQKSAILEAQILALNQNREELIATINTKHEESLNYYHQIQRLSQFLTAETEKCRNFEIQLQSLQNQIDNNEDTKKKDAVNEKLSDQNEFLKEKCEKMTQTLVQEQTNTKKLLFDASEREQSLARELERLREHLLEVEEMYTKELLQAEQKSSVMQTKVNEIEQREKNSSNIYTSVSIRANQQVETLQNQLQLVTNQRDDLRHKLSDNEDQINKQSAALTNLQLVLEQFQKEKQKDVHNETERIRRQIAVEKTVQADLQKEISNLKIQLKESKEGLQAASRLSDQLEEANKNAFNMNAELGKIRAKLAETERKYDDMVSQPDAKVDKMLIKNLIIGFISSNNNLNKDQTQVLKIISTVLDFSQQDTDKMQMNKNAQGSWISSLLHPTHPGQNLSQESLSLAFVKFLEKESKPMVLPSLLDTSGANRLTEQSAAGTKISSSPLLLNEMVLPTFNDYGQRSSSSILKDVLKDNQ